MNLSQSVVQALSAMRLSGLRDYGLVNEHDLAAMVKVWVGGLEQAGIAADLVQRTAVCFSIGQDRRPQDRAGTFPSLPEFVSEARRLFESDFIRVGIPVPGEENTVRLVRVRRGEEIPAVAAAPMALPHGSHTFAEALQAAKVRRMSTYDPADETSKRTIIEEERRRVGGD